jgi:hypothetical protein
MELSAHDVLQRLAAGDLALRDLAGLGKREIDSIRALAQSQGAVGRHRDAATLYEALEALEPDVPEHKLSRAASLAKAGDDEGAVACIDAFLDTEGLLPAGARARALLLRAQLTERTDPEAAKQALVYLQVLAEQSPEARAVLQGVA